MLCWGQCRLHSGGMGIEEMTNCCSNYNPLMALCRSSNHVRRMMTPPEGTRDRAAGQLCWEMSQRFPRYVKKRLECNRTTHSVREGTSGQLTITPIPSRAFVMMTKLHVREGEIIPHMSDLASVDRRAAIRLFRAQSYPALRVGSR